MTPETLKELLRLHTLWLEGKEGGKRANLEGADLREANLVRANLQRASLGTTTELGKKLKILGACQDSLDWVDRQKDHKDVRKLLRTAAPEWLNWLEKALGGKPTMTRLNHVFEYKITGVKW